jgi:hypothetical protein
MEITRNKEIIQVLLKKKIILSSKKNKNKMKIKILILTFYKVKIKMKPLYR